jgi:hypothetical protein
MFLPYSSHVIAMLLPWGWKSKARTWWQRAWQEHHHGKSMVACIKYRLRGCSGQLIRSQSIDSIAPGATMAEPHQSLLLRGMKTGEFVGAVVHPSSPLQVRHFEWKQLVCFMGEQVAAEYCTVTPCVISYRPQNTKSGTFIEVVTWQVTFIQCAKLDIEVQMLHVVSEQGHDDGDADSGASSSTSPAPCDSFLFQ